MYKKCNNPLHQVVEIKHVPYTEHFNDDYLNKGWIILETLQKVFPEGTSRYEGDFFISILIGKLKE